MREALQLYYTSSRLGLGGGAGFQIRASSPGIDPADARVIVERSAYRRPFTDNEPQGVMDYDTVFPVAFRFYPLPSGRFGLTRVSYAGEDYSGRSGNLFAHTLVVEAAPGDEVWPADLFDHSHWRRSLDPGEDARAPEPLLPVLIRSRGGFTAAQLGRFLKSRKGRPERLRHMVRAILLAADTGRTLVLRDGDTERMQWIACLHRCFPHTIAWTLPFSSYEFEAMGSPLITGTVERTDFSFDETERSYEHVMIDEIRGLHSENPIGEKERNAAAYADLVVGLLLDDAHRLDDFYAFATSFGVTEAGPALCTIGALFSFSLGQAAAALHPRLPELARFALQHRQSENWDWMAGYLGPSLNAWAAGGSFDDKLLAVQFAAACASGGGDAFANAWRTLVLAAMEREGGAAALETAERTLDAELHGAGRRKAEAVLQPAFIDTLVERIPHTRLEGAMLAIAMIAQSLGATGRAPAHDEPEYVQLVSAVVGKPGSAPAVLSALLRDAHDAAAVSAVCRIAQDLDDTLLPTVGEALVDRLARTANDDDIRSRLPDQLISAEWRALIGRARAPADAYLSHRHAVIDRLASARRSPFDEDLHRDLLAWLAPRLDKAALRSLAIDLLKRREFRHLPEVWRSQALDAFNAELRLDTSNGRELSWLVEEAALCGHTLRPDWLRLHRLLDAARAAPASTPGALAAAVSDAMCDIAATVDGDYQRIVTVLLGSAAFHEAHDHVAVARILFVPDRAPALMQAYGQWIGGLRRAPGRLGDIAAAWIEDGRIAGSDTCLLWPKVCRELAAALVRLDTAGHDMAVRQLDGPAGHRRSRAVEQRRADLRQAVEDINNSLGGLVRGKMNSLKMAARRALGIIPPK
ncbi:hypothetical protein SAMN02982917_3049 [Azospirillum oryzae]|uniref:Uncharacterized protein n=1 Tax=Azospirillum oryzae TaxID=286727 RepID=A0A1X7FMU2_9PROT|nr:hypothetical protein [Azospirillum oryzae]SMF55164.1 hypothetical protein SAMN02982917_3049 [Azospirillum oryzae]